MTEDEDRRAKEVIEKDLRWARILSVEKQLLGRFGESSALLWMEYVEANPDLSAEQLAEKFVPALREQGKKINQTIPYIISDLDEHWHEKWRELCKANPEKSPYFIAEAVAQLEDWERNKDAFMVEYKKSREAKEFMIKSVALIAIIAVLTLLLPYILQG
jgi:hypothetical protein